MKKLKDKWMILRLPDSQDDKFRDYEMKYDGLFPRVLEAFATEEFRLSTTMTPKKIDLPLTITYKSNMLFFYDLQTNVRLQDINSLTKRMDIRCARSFNIDKFMKCGIIDIPSTCPKQIFKVFQNQINKIDFVNEMLNCFINNKKTSRISLKNILYNNASYYNEVQFVQDIKKNEKITNSNDIKRWFSINQNASENTSLTRERQSTVQVIPTRKIKYDSDDSPKVKDTLSVIFVRGTENKVFKLTFNAINCILIHLYTKERPFVGRDTDKNLQSYSKSYCYEMNTPSLARLYTRKKDYFVNPEMEGRTSIMSLKQKVGRVRQVEPRPPKQKTGMSANKTNVKKSVVFLETNGMNSKLYPKAMNLEFSKPYYGESLNNSLVRDVGLETMEKKKNKGPIIAKYKDDILKFTFGINDINYQRIPEFLSQSSQVKDNCIYMRTYSEIGDKMVYVPLPKAIYEYRDPMVDIRRKNRDMFFNNVEPRWMADARKRQMIDNKKCQQVDPAKKAYDATTGSTIRYEGPGTMNKARDGLLACEWAEKDKITYEKWVAQTQNENMHLSVNESGEYSGADVTIKNSAKPTYSFDVPHDKGCNLANQFYSNDIDNVLCDECLIYQPMNIERLCDVCQRLPINYEKLTCDVCPMNIHMNDRRPCEVCPMNRLILSEKRRCDLNCNKHVLVNFNCLVFPTIIILLMSTLIRDKAAK